MKKLLLCLLTCAFISAPIGVFADNSDTPDNERQSLLAVHENLAAILVSYTRAIPDVYQKTMVVTPDALKKGDKVGIAAPAGTTSQEKLDAAVAFLKAKGFEVVYDKKSITSAYAYDGSGKENIKNRADAFNKLAKDAKIKAIFCIRGGYGAMQILDQIDYEALRKNRPIIVGYSDITAIHAAAFKYAGLVSFHGPMLSSNAGQTKSFDLLFDQIMTPKKAFSISNLDGADFKTLHSGKAEGRLIGGNMTLISVLLGTKYEYDFKDKILFIEETGESPYRIHRMLWQLKLAGVFDQVKGIVIGSFTDCNPDNAAGQPENAVFDVLKDVKVPVVYNVQAGHNNNPITLPMGAMVRINGAHLEIIQNVVKAN